MIIFEFLKFIIFCIVFFIIPGFGIPKFLKIGLARSVKLFIAFFSGIAIFIYLTFVIRLFNLPFYYLYLYILFDIWFIFYYKNNFFIHTHFKFDYKDKLVAVVLIIGSILMVISHLKSGYYPDGLHLLGARDTLWRLSIISSLKQNFPPQNFGYSSEILNNYHYFYDLLIAAASKLLFINSISLYTRDFALISSWLFLFCIYNIFRYLKIPKIFSLVGTILTALTGNLSYLLPFLSKQYNFFSKSNIFMSDQPYDQSFNPFNLLAYAIFIGLIILIMEWEKKPTIKLFILISFVLAALCGIKIYAGILICIGLGILIVIKVLKKQFKFYYLFPLLVIFPVIYAIKGKNFSILSYSPGWLLIKMIEDQDRLALNNMALKEQYYRNTGNIHRFWQIKIEQLLIYFIGNLNIRIFSIFILFNKIWKIYFSKDSFIFYLSLIFSAFIIPLLFNQTRNSYDSIQFTPYGLLLCSILLVLVLNQLFNKINKIIFYFIIIAIFILGIPTNYSVTNSNINSGSFVISKNEVSALEFLNRISLPDSVILTDIDNIKMIYMYVPVIAQRPAFLSGISLMNQTGIDTNNREQQIKSFFLSDNIDALKIKEKRDFLKRNNIKYIYLSNESLHNKDLMDKLDMPLIYSENSVLIYEIK